MTGLELLAAFVPAGIDLLKWGARKLTGANESAPVATNPAEYAEMQNADANKLNALSQLDTLGDNVSRWVQDLRGATRYVIANLVVVFYVYSELTLKHSDGLESLCASVAFFLFGEKVWRRAK